MADLRRNYELAMVVFALLEIDINASVCRPREIFERFQFAHAQQGRILGGFELGPTQGKRY